MGSKPAGLELFIGAILPTGVLVSLFMPICHVRYTTNLSPLELILTDSFSRPGTAGSHQSNGSFGHCQSRFSASRRATLQVYLSKKNSRSNIFCPIMSGKRMKKREICQLSNIIGMFGTNIENKCRSYYCNFLQNGHSCTSIAKDNWSGCTKK